MENTFISPTDLSGRLGTKRNLYDILCVDSKKAWFQLILVGLYLPPFDKCPTFFLKEIFAKRKLVSMLRRKTYGDYIIGSKTRSEDTPANYKVQRTWCETCLGTC